MSSTSPAPTPSSADQSAELPTEAPSADSAAALPAVATAGSSGAAEAAADAVPANVDAPAQGAAQAEGAQVDAVAADATGEAQPQAEAGGAKVEDGTAQDAGKAEGKDASPAATAAKLAELFPALFKGAPKPLKLRIQVDIQERAPGVFSKQALSAFFRRHTGATSYLLAVSKGKQRFDLDGQPAGELSDEHRKVAADELARRRANANTRREQEEAGRRQRAGLLRDFETTKLTTANFCALKGIAADQLDGLLAQARAEALEEAQRPRRPEHGHGGGPGGPGQRPGHRPDHGRGGNERRGEGGGRRDGGRGPGAGRPGGPGPRPQGDRPAGQARGDRPEGGRPPRAPAEGKGGEAGAGNSTGNNNAGTGAERSGEPRREGRPPRRG